MIVTCYVDNNKTYAFCRSYIFESGAKIAVFTWFGCLLRLTGKNEAAYVSKVTFCFSAELVNGFYGILCKHSNSLVDLEEERSARTVCEIVANLKGSKNMWYISICKTMYFVSNWKIM